MINTTPKQNLNKNDNNEQTLIKAVRDNNLELVKYLMTTEFDNDNQICDFAKKTAVSWAITDGNLDMLKYFLKKEFRKYIDLKNYSQPMFEEVIKNKNKKIVEFFIDSPILKKHINMYEAIKSCFKLDTADCLDFLVHDCKVNIDEFVVKLKNDYSFSIANPHVKNFLDYYELKNEVGIKSSKNIKEKKIKI